MNDQAQKYLQTLADNDDERKALHDSIAADIVKAGAAKGYTFTEEELETAMQGGTGSGTALGTSIGWG